jgi:hypothetical protein
LGQTGGQNKIGQLGGSFALFCLYFLPSRNFIMSTIGKSAPAGKGDRPRKVDGHKYRKNYDIIQWNKYPDWICNTCGKNYGNRPEGNPYGATYHINECGICGKTTEVTEPRDFGHLKKGWDK